MSNGSVIEFVCSNVAALPSRIRYPEAKDSAMALNGDYSMSKLAVVQDDLGMNPEGQLGYLVWALLISNGNFWKPEGFALSGETGELLYGSSAGRMQRARRKLERR